MVRIENFDRERFRSIASKFKNDASLNHGKMPRFRNAEDVYRHFGIPKELPLHEKVRILRRVRSVLENNINLVVTEQANSEMKLKSGRKIDPFSPKYVNPKDAAFFGRSEAKELNDEERSLGIDPSLPIKVKDKMLKEADTSLIFDGKDIVFARKVTKKRPVSKKEAKRLM